MKSFIYTSMNMQIILIFIDGRGNENFVYSLNFGTWAHNKLAVETKPLCSDCAVISILVINN